MVMRQMWFKNWFQKMKRSIARNGNYFEKMN